MPSVDAGRPDLPVARELLGRLAPELANAALRPAAGGSSKWVWHVGEGHVLRLARDRASREAMRVERRLLRRLEGRLGLATPRPVRAEDAQGADLCVAAPGEALDWRDWAGLGEHARRAWAAPFAGVVADLHEVLPAADAAALGLVAYAPPETEALRARLVGPLREGPGARLLDASCAALEALQAGAAPAAVLLHGDLSHHNLGWDPATGQVVGVFDFGSACLGDPHRDLRYAPGLESGSDEVAATYERRTGRPVSRARQRAWHAISALENLAWSLDHEPAELQAARWGWVEAVACWDLGFVDAL